VSIGPFGKDPGYIVPPDPMLIWNFKKNVLVLDFIFSYTRGSRKITPLQDNVMA